MPIALFPTVCLVVIVVESWNGGRGPTHPCNRCCAKPRKPKEKVSVWWNCVSLGSREERPKPMCFEEKARENPARRIPPRTLKNRFSPPTQLHTNLQLHTLYVPFEFAIALDSKSCGDGLVGFQARLVLGSNRGHVHGVHHSQSNGLRLLLLWNHSCPVRRVGPPHGRQGRRQGGGGAGQQSGESMAVTNG